MLGLSKPKFSGFSIDLPGPQDEVGGNVVSPGFSGASPILASNTRKNIAWTTGHKENLCSSIWITALRVEVFKWTQDSLKAGLCCRGATRCGRIDFSSESQVWYLIFHQTRQKEQKYSLWRCPTEGTTESTWLPRAVITLSQKGQFWFSSALHSGLRFP